MADDNTNNNIQPTPSPPLSARRSSFAGDTFANLFNPQRSSISRSPSDAHPPSTTQQPAQSYPGPITTAAAQAQRRRLSLTTLGLSGSPNSTSPFGSYHSRRDSYVSGGMNEAIDESAIEEDVGGNGIPSQNPFGRRMSFGAKALRDVRATSGTSTGQNNNTSTSGEGFNWSDNFRNRAERTASIAGGIGGTGPPPPPASLQHTRAKSVATMEPPATVIPKPKEQVRPDHFQERILKGDFYMD